MAQTISRIDRPVPKTVRCVPLQWVYASAPDTRPGATHRRAEALAILEMLGRLPVATSAPNTESDSTSPQ